VRPLKPFRKAPFARISPASRSAVGVDPGRFRPARAEPGPRGRGVARVPAASFPAIATVELAYAGRRVRLPDLPEYAKFYRKLAAGAWEPETFRTLGRNLDGNTVLVDIGAWIGVTPFWAAQTAKAVIAVEPDPKCQVILEALAPLAPNVRLLKGALADRAGVVVHAVDGFGSSETSVLALGQGERLSVRGLSVDEIMRHAEPADVFVKIDVEGYEYALLGELAKLRRHRVRGVQIALHPQLFETTLPGPWIWRRARTIWMTWRIGRLFASFLSGPVSSRYGGLGLYVLKGVLFRREPKGTDLVFERQPPRRPLPRRKGKAA
jgi:FkbM family methyltransferase